MSIIQQRVTRSSYIRIPQEYSAHFKDHRGLDYVTNFSLQCLLPFFMQEVINKQAKCQHGKVRFVTDKHKGKRQTVRFVLDIQLLWVPFLVLSDSFLKFPKSTFTHVSGFLDVLKSLNNDIGKEKTIMKISRLFIECRTSDHANYCSSWKIYSQRISSLLISSQEMHLSMCLSMASLVSSLNFLRQRGHSSTRTFSFSPVTSLLDVVVSLPKETGVSITSSAVSG